MSAGTFSGLMQTAITTPTELLKIRLQLQTQLPGNPGYVGPIRLLKQVTMREGIPGALSCSLATASSATLLSGERLSLQFLACPEASAPAACETASLTQSVVDNVLWVIDSSPP